MFNTIVLSGAATNGFLIIGALDQLFESGCIGKTRNLIGTSIGAIIAFLLSLGMTPKTIFFHLSSLQINDFSFNEVETFFNSFGMDNGEKFMARIIDIIIVCGESPLITFSQFYKKYNKNLVIVGANVSKHKTEYFSVESYPNLKIIEAIRISISIPFFFTPVKLNGDYYCDGAITCNYAIDYASENFPGDKIIGFCVDNLQVTEIKNFQNYVYSIFASGKKKNNLRNTVRLETKHDSLNISLTDSEKKDMFQSGKDMCLTYLKGLSPLHNKLPFKLDMIKRRHSF